MQSFTLTTESLADIVYSRRDSLERLVDVRLSAKIRRRVSPGDILQAAFITAASHVCDFDGDSAKQAERWFVRFLWNAIRNTVKSHTQLAKRSVNSESSVDGDPESQREFITAIATGLRPDQAAEMEETCIAIRSLIDRLPAKQAQVVRHKFFDGMSHAEIAVAIGSTEQAVGGLVKRANARLRDMASDYDF